MLSRIIGIEFFAKDVQNVLMVTALFVKYTCTNIVDILYYMQCWTHLIKDLIK